MSRVMTQEERFRRMVETPVSKLIPSLAVPTIISMLITSIYNMADTYFVSQINTSASAAVGVSYSLMSMIQAFGFTLGMGGGNYLSRVLGTQDTKKAEQIASTAFCEIFMGFYLLQTVGNPYTLGGSGSGIQWVTMSLMSYSAVPSYQVHESE